MSEAILKESVVTIAEFEAFLDGQEDDSLWELVAGRVVAMTNPTEVHAQIAANIGAPLKLAMDPKGCRVYQGGIGVQRSDLPQMRVEHYRRTDLGWELETLTHAEDILLLDALAFTIMLDRVYFGVEPTNIHRLAS